MGLRAAMIGLGFMGYTHTEAIRRLGGEVIGCLDSSPEATKAGVARLGIPRAYASLEECVADPEVDIVHICTPNYLHYPMTKAALEAGKHVLCEKPLAISSDESAALVRLAREKGLVGAVNYNLRFYPLCQEARSRIRQGEIGEVRIIHGHYLQDWLFYPTDWNWRLETDLGGEMRAVTDIGTHWLDMVMWMTGLRVSAVVADFATMIPTRFKPKGRVETFATKLEKLDATDEVAISTEDYASILLQFDNGARGCLTVSQVSAGHKNRTQWEINGTEASLRWQQEDANHLWIGYRDKPNEVITKDPALIHEAARAMASYPGGHPEGYPDTFKQLFNAVYGYIKAGDFSAPAPFPTFEDGHHEIALCDAIQESALERRWVEVVIW